MVTEEANLTKQGNLSFSHIIACLPTNSVMAVLCDCLGEGCVMLHTLIHPAGTNTSHQVTQVRLNQRVFWVKDGLKMEFWGNGCA